MIIAFKDGKVRCFEDVSDLSDYVFLNGMPSGWNLIKSNSYYYLTNDEIEELIEGLGYECHEIKHFTDEDFSM